MTGKWFSINAWVMIDGGTVVDNSACWGKAAVLFRETRTWRDDRFETEERFVEVQVCVSLPSQLGGDDDDPAAGFVTGPMSFVLNAPLRVEIESVDKSRLKIDARIAFDGWSRDERGYWLIGRSIGGYKLTIS